MNSFGAHIRDTIRLDQALVDHLPKTPGLEWTFVARVVTLAGATIDDRPVTILAGEVRGESQLRLRNTSTAPFMTAGTPGPPLTGICEDLFACAAVSVGGTGGKGATGEKGDPLPSTLAGADKPDPEPGNPGKPGKPGLPGGAGGPITVRFAVNHGGAAFM